MVGVSYYQLTFGTHVYHGEVFEQLATDSSCSYYKCIHFLYFMSVFPPDHYLQAGEWLTLLNMPFSYIFR